MCAPSSAKRMAVARPMPLAPPMIMAILPSRSRRVFALSSILRRSSGQYSISQASASDSDSKRSTASAPAIASIVAR